MVARVVRSIVALGMASVGCTSGEPPASEPSVSDLSPLSLEVTALAGTPGGLGIPGAIAALPDGGIVVLDQRGLEGPVVHQYDASGQWVRRLGRRGSGPGEYRMPVHLAAAADGSVLLDDLLGRRLLLYPTSSDAQGGEARSFPLIPAGRGTVLRAAENGGWFVQVATGEGPNASALHDVEGYRWLHLDASGRISDSIAAPGLWPPSRPPVWFEPPQLWAPLTQNLRIRFAIDTLAFTVLNATGRVVQRVVIDSHPPPPVQDGEREAIERLNEYNRVASRGMATEIVVPKRKAAFAGFAVAPDGRVWVQRNLLGVASDQSWPIVPDGPPDMPTTRYLMPVQFVGICPDGSGRVRIAPAGMNAVGYDVRAAFLPDAVWILRTLATGAHEITRWTFQRLPPCESE